MFLCGELLLWILQLCITVNLLSYAILAKNCILMPSKIAIKSLFSHLAYSISLLIAYAMLF